MGSVRTFNPNPHDLLELRRALQGIRIQVPPSTFDQTTDPVVTGPAALRDDITKGWRVGSIWFNTTTKTIWECFSNAEGAAVWVSIGSEDHAEVVTPAGTIDGTADTMVLWDDSENKHVRATVNAVASKALPTSTGVIDQVLADSAGGWVSKDIDEILWSAVWPGAGVLLVSGAGGNTHNPITAPTVTGHVLTANTTLAEKMEWAAPDIPDVFTARATQVVTAGTAISVTDGSPVTPVTMVGSVTMTAAPTIAAGRNGQLVILVNDDTADTLTLTDAGALAGSLLRLGASTRALTPGATLALVYDTAQAAWVEQNFNTLVTITPAINTHTINIGAGASNAQNAEVAGSGTHTPTFAWTYTGVPSAGTVDVSAGGDPATDYPATILTPFASLVGPAFNKGTSVGTVRTFTPSITINGVVKTTPTATVTYINRRYAGPNSQSTLLSSAQVLALDGAGGTSELSTTQYGSFTVSTVAGEYIWYAHRSALTAVASNGMSVDGEIAGFVDMGATLNHTNDSGFAETFRLYRTTNTNFGASKTFVAASSRRINRIYIGPATDTDPITTGHILALDDTAHGESVLDTTVAGTYSVTIEAGEYLWFCHADAIDDLVTIKDNATGFAIAGSYRTTISHTNDMGYVEDYRCWRSDNVNIFPTGGTVVVT